jgi:hypothetical protein
MAQQYVWPFHRPDTLPREIKEVEWPKAEDFHHWTDGHHTPGFRTQFHNLMKGPGVKHLETINQCISNDNVFRKYMLMARKRLHAVSDDPARFTHAVQSYRRMYPGTPITTICLTMKARILKRFLLDWELYMARVAPEALFVSGRDVRPSEIVIFYVTDDDHDLPACDYRLDSVPGPEPAYSVVRVVHDAEKLMARLQARAKRDGTRIHIGGTLMKDRYALGDKASSSNAAASSSSSAAAAGSASFSAVAAASSSRGVPGSVRFDLAGADEDDEEEDGQGDDDDIWQPAFMPTDDVYKWARQQGKNNPGSRYRSPLVWVPGVLASRASQEAYAERTSRERRAPRKYSQ